MNKILITTSSFDMTAPEITALKADGYEVVLNPHARRLTEQEVSDLLTPDVVGMIAGVEPLTAAVMARATGLRVISRCGAGLDNVDREAAASHGIAVTSTPDAPARAVAELAAALILDTLRGVSRQDRAMRGGAWERPMGGLLSARTVGIVGFGRIGRQLAKNLSGFGPQIVAYDPVPAARADGVTMMELEQLLAKVDIVSLHIPYTEQTRGLMNADRIARMKKGAILINTARGGLVDEAALAEALKSGHLSAAALDVFEQEPYTGPLTLAENVTLTAHVGSYARETRFQQESEAAANLLAALRQNTARRTSHG